MHYFTYENIMHMYTNTHSYRFIILPFPKADYTYYVQASLVKTSSRSCYSNIAQIDFTFAVSAMMLLVAVKRGN